MSYALSIPFSKKIKKKFRIFCEIKKSKHNILKMSHDIRQKIFFQKCRINHLQGAVSFELTVTAGSSFDKIFFKKAIFLKFAF